MGAEEPAAGPVEEPPKRLEERVAALEAEQIGMQLAWAEVLDKITAWGNRQAARDRARVKAVLSESPEDAPETTNGGQPSPMVPPGDPKAELRRRAAQMRGR